jgi:hypothetical protein
MFLCYIPCASAKRGDGALKRPFYTDVGDFDLLSCCVYVTIWLKKYTNSAKKLLLLPDLTIIIKSLVIRINGYQS